MSKSKETGGEFFTGFAACLVVIVLSCSGVQLYSAHKKIDNLQFEVETNEMRTKSAFDRATGYLEDLDKADDYLEGRILELERRVLPKKIEIPPPTFEPFKPCADDKTAARYHYRTRTMRFFRHGKALA